METSVIILIAVTIFAVFIIQKMLKSKNKNEQQRSKEQVLTGKKRHITTSQLQKELELLRDGENEYHFFGFKLDNIGSLYLYNHVAPEKFRIQFEPLTESQYPFVEKLKEYADSKGFQHAVITPKNSYPRNIDRYTMFGDTDDIEFLIKADTNIPNTLSIVEELLHIVFGNNNNTKYETVI